MVPLSHRNIAVAVLVALIAVVAVDAGGTCNGMGRRYCLNAHRTQEECPKPCTLQNCIDNPTVSYPKRGGGWDEEKPTWEELALKSTYEYVYTDSDWLCLAGCWYKPEQATCKRWSYAEGNRYCVKMSCEHDERDRYAGCHSDSNGNRKLPWHRPTCKECLHVFPRACAGELTEHVRAEDARKAEEARLLAARQLESAARTVCYDRYFDFFHQMEEAYEVSSEATSEDINESSSGRRLLANDDDDDDDDNDRRRRRAGDSSDVIDESSDAVDESSDESRDVKDTAPQKKDEHATGFLMKQARQKIESGEWSCPAPQCLTSSLELLQKWHAPPPPPSSPPSPPPAPWYHDDSANGFCSWEQCASGPQGEPWCRESAKNCVTGCGGVWCPMGDVPRSWNPVGRSDFVSKAAIQMPRRKAPAPVWNKPTAFDISVCGAVVSDIKAEEAEGLPWDMTRHPFPSLTLKKSTNSSAKNVTDHFQSYPSGLIPGVESSAVIEMKALSLGADDHDHEEGSWDSFLRSDNNKQVAYVVLQLADAPNAVNQTGLMAAAVELTGAEAGNILVLDEPTVTISEEAISTLILLVAAKDPSEVVVTMEAYGQEDIAEIMFRHAGAAFLPWSMTAEVKEVSGNLVSGLELFETSSWLSTTHIAMIAAAGMLAAIILGIMLWAACRKRRTVPAVHVSTQEIAAAK
eukprot:jgi/Tetstr1/422346/TSEL_013189.t1